MHLRPFQPSDISALVDIEVACNLEDPLALYQSKNITTCWASYRSTCLRFLRTVLLQPGTVCWVAETDVSDAPPDASPKQEQGANVVGWAIWTRNGASNVAESWQRPGLGFDLSKSAVREARNCPLQSELIPGRN